MNRWDQVSTVWDEFFWDSPDAIQNLPAKTKKINTRTMSSNPTPENNDILRALADLIADGCHTHEVAIGIKQNTEAAIRASITALSAAELQVGLKKQAVDNAYTALQTKDAEGQAVLMNCKLRLAQKLGTRWNADWEPTGFPHQSTAIPDTQDERFTLLDDLKAYFTAVPANESADMGATAAACGAAWTALSDARQAVASTESAHTEARNARSVAVYGLRKRVRGVIVELEGLMSDDDPRWEAFGLSIPANPAAPDPVASVTAALLGSGRIELGWSYSTRAVRFRVQTMVLGVDVEWQNYGSFKDLETILKGFTAGQTVKMQVIASNDGGDAAPSPEASVVVT